MKPRALPRTWIAAAALPLVSLFAVFAQEDAGISGRDRETLDRWELTIDGVARSALVYAPSTAKTTPAPLVFVFHGHGGTSGTAARTFAIHRLWPEAISIYPQGLNTPGQITDPEGTQPGWQRRVGDQGDRDLKFFDAAIARAKELYRIDEKRVYATGHSNGGSFTYLLWEARGKIFAAFAPSGAAAAASVGKLDPKPAMHIAGESDPLVRFQWQRRMMDAVRRINGCAENGEPWGKYSTQYHSAAELPSSNSSIPAVTHSLSMLRL